LLLFTLRNEPLLRVEIGREGGGESLFAFMFRNAVRLVVRGDTGTFGCSVRGGGSGSALTKDLLDRLLRYMSFDADELLFMGSDLCWSFLSSTASVSSFEPLIRLPVSFGSTIPCIFSSLTLVNESYSQIRDPRSLHK